MTDHRATILSGVQPSGELHLGNYIGALRQWAGLVDTYECYFCVVDLHALTDPYRPLSPTLVERVRDVAALYVAAGISADKCAIFAQSHVPEHVRLMWLLTCVTPLGNLERMTQFKSKSAARERIDAGLLVYPVLQAADILVYDTDIVPVGNDQKQHIELCRDIAERFNGLYGDVFRLPVARIPTAGSRVMGLDDPEEKMSKSHASSRPNHAIGLLDPPDVIRRKIKRAVTDSGTSVDPGCMGPGTRNLIDIYAALSGQGFDPVVSALSGIGYGQLKSRLADLVVATLEPIRERYESLRDDEAAIDTLLADGAARARVRAAIVVDRAERALGLR